MNIAIQPTTLHGDIEAVSSKSVAHRMLICAAFADAPTTLNIKQASDDIKATVHCLKALGADITRNEDTYTITPITTAKASPTLDCGESGSTLRFLLPIAAALGNNAHIIGHGRLPNRPLSELTKVMKEHNVTFCGEQLPLTLSGRLHGGEFRIAGNISSQYITGLLLALPLLKEDSTIEITTELESASYIDITLSVLKAFGVSIQATGNHYQIKGNQRYRSPGILTVEGDWSNAAFFLSAAALGNNVSLGGLNTDSAQGDRRIVRCLEQFGAENSGDRKKISFRFKELKGGTVDLRDIPDLLPILAVTAAFAKGDTTFIHAARLRLKESDRLESTATMIRDLGGSAETTADTITIHGTGLIGGTVNSCNDHRIAMAAAIAATCCKKPVVILGAEAVNKSYPEFFKDYNHLGGAAYVL